MLDRVLGALILVAAATPPPTYDAGPSVASTGNTRRSDGASRYITADGDEDPGAWTVASTTGGMIALYVFAGAGAPPAGGGFASPPSVALLGRV